MICALRIQAFDDPSWDPMATLGQFLGVGIVMDPYPQIAELRRQAPVHKIDMRRHLGLLPEDEETYHKMTLALLCVSIDPPHAEEAKVKLGNYYRARLEECRGKEGDDIVTRLANTEIAGEYLPEDIIISFLRLLLSAASDTTYRTTSNLFVGLLTNPAQLEALYRDRSLVPAAIEEVLRWEAPVTFNQRIAMRDHTLGGVEIPKGALVEVWNGAGNRDPGHYPEPDRFDLFRKRDRHFAFSAGPHVCLGQHLARVEMTRALNSILDRLPNLRLDPDQPPPQIAGINGRAPFAVHACFG